MLCPMLEAPLAAMSPARTTSWVRSLLADAPNRAIVSQFRLAVPRLLCLLVLIAFAACTSERREWPTPPIGGDTTGTGPPGTVQKATLTVTVQPEAGDSSLTRALGWIEGVPDATVVIQRVGSSATSSATVDAAGVARFSDLLPGDYTISALRQLQTEERARLAPDDRDVNAFGGGATVALAAPGLARSISVAAGRRGSLVISEVWAGKPMQPSGEYYYFSDFIEIYNNSDTTIALANKLIVSPQRGNVDAPLQPCSRYVTFTGDPEGIWAGFLYRFPSNARLLAPGEMAVVATDALNHTALGQGVFDLSGADFEFRGGADADNPGVPNMISTGGMDGGFIQSHGFYPVGVREVLALVDSIDPATLPMQIHPALNVPFVRVPTARVLDVLYWTMQGLNSPYPECAESPVPLSLERQRNEALGLDDLRSLHRAVAYMLPDGRKVLLRTRTSARDFFPAAPTPFALP